MLDWKSILANLGGLIVGLYLFQGRYSSAAMKAMIEKPQNRREAAGKMIEALGGKLILLYFCFGSEDVVALIEAPDDETMAACSLLVGASGSLSAGSTTKLMSVETAMKAMEMAGRAASQYTPAAG